MAPAEASGGVTLLELLITLAIVAIVASIAYPSYRQHLLRAHRTEAIEALLSLAAEQERHHLAYGRYAEHLDAVGALGLPIPATTATGMYDLGLEEAGPTHFVAVATPTAGGRQATDRLCTRMILRDTGRRTAADADGRDTTRECWG